MQRWIASLLCLLGAAFFAWVFHLRYWKHRRCIEAALSSCPTPEGDNLTQGGMVWAVPALLLLLLAAGIAISAWRRGRRRG